MLKKLLKKIITEIKKLFTEEVHYINGPETLPPPLTKEEELKIMEQIINGNEKAREPLITHNLRLVVYIAKKFDSTGINVEDLISIGTIGLIKAVNTFRPEKNIKIDEPLNVDWDGNELLLSDILGSDPDTVNKNIEQEVECNILTNAVDNLSGREKNIMQLRFGLGGYKEHTQKEVADLLGISQSYISRLEKKIIVKLKRQMEFF